MNMAEIPRIYTALAEWGACMLYICLLPKRYTKPRTAAIAVLVLVVQTLFLESTGNVSLVLWVPCMVVSIGIMLGFLYGCAKIRIRDAIYYCVHTLVLAEMMASCERQLFWFLWPGGEASFHGRCLLLGWVYLTALVLAFLLLRDYLSQPVSVNISTKELLGAVVIGIAVFAISNMGFIFDNTIFTKFYPREIMTVRTLVDMGGYAILYAHFILCCQSRYRKELEAVNSILENQYTQYKQSKESIELINQKYHDLKHQITALRMEKDDEKRKEWLDAMEEDIIAYEAQNKTGHPVLDVVLTSKSMYCQKRKISLTCVVDGASLNFMEVRDICTIFGNALDNAIESVKKIADVDRRLIHVSVSAQQGFVMMRFENYFEGKLNYEEGLPATTKKNHNYHGYGLKSIQLTAQKYDGRVSIETRNHWFELDVIVPIRK